MDYLKAAATSAMRDASNAEAIIDQVRQETGIDIEIISGGEEASFIYENHIAENLDKTHSYLYIDVGGGSTELTFFAETKLIFKESFNIGTIRLVEKPGSGKSMGVMKDFIKRETKGHAMTSSRSDPAEISIKYFPFRKERMANRFLWNCSKIITKNSAIFLSKEESGFINSGKTGPM